MKRVSTDMMAHLQQDLTTLATLWWIQRVDGAIYLFTDFDMDLQYSLTGAANGAEINDYFDLLWFEGSVGLSRSNLSDKAQLDISNMQVDGIVDSVLITEQDIRRRLWDYAKVKIVMVNWVDVMFFSGNMGDIRMATGNFGPVTLRERRWSVDLRGLSERLNVVVGDVYQPTCRVDLGSTECGVDLQALLQTGTVTSTDGVHNINASGVTFASGYYDGGLVTFTGGLNTGVSLEVTTSAGLGGSPGGNLTFFLTPPFPISVGDTFSIVPGCDKLFTTCKNKFTNAVNFRGENSVPSPDHMQDFPDFKAPHFG